MTLYCKQPDHDVPSLICGYPLPCPYHTIVVTEKAIVNLPESVNIETLDRVIKVTRAIYDGLEAKHD